MFTRRQVLKQGALISLAPIVPSFLARTARAAEAEKDRRVLVVVQLDGGNDGLNTVVPFRDDNYARLRPKLRLESGRLIKIADDLALHLSLKGVAKLLDDDRLEIVQGVGYPNPDRSHFKSMAIWHSARLDETEHGQYGWLGRALDVGGSADRGPQAVYTGAGALPVALWSRRSAAITVKSKDDLTLAAPARLLASAAAAEESDELGRFVAESSRDAFATAERLAALAKTDTATETAYQDSNLAAQLKMVSTLIKADTPARVFYTSQGGYDTHAAQLFDHSRLLGEFSSAVKAFLDDMAASGLGDRVLLLAFSEFGRRAAENGSEGTDHGSAAPVFLAGPKLAARLHGPTPNLADLIDGDVKVAIDFRQVYATLCDRWLEVPSAGIVGGRFEQLPLLGG
jgi:uncharacterized protein (DUF1501 family)